MTLSVDRATELSAGDLADLCDAAEEAIRAGGGFGWVEVPPRAVMERYWRGVLAVPDRHLVLGRIEGTIAGSVQLVRPPLNNEAQRLTGQITTSFVAPWAQGRGLARQMLEHAVALAREHGLSVLNLDVRETQSRAIQLYESQGFTRWGEHPHYALIQGRFIRGFFYTKLIDPLPES